MILLTDGFAIYKDKKRQQLFKALAKKNGLILLTDSDAAGFRIRNYITNLVGAQNVVQAYVPAIHGKEKRKPQPGKEGLLGVEGVDDAIVVKILREALGAEADAAAPRPEGRGKRRSAQGAPSPIPTCTIGAFPARQAARSGKQSSSTRWACRRASPKRSWWRR